MRIHQAIRTAGLAVLALSGIVPRTHADPVVPDIVYTPSVTIIPEVRLPDGDIRSYRTPDGVTYWKEGLPVYRGDHVKLNVFVASGGVDLAEAIVRLDNVRLSHRTAAPWNVSLETGALTEGYHFVEAWARTGGDQPRDATHTLVFFIDPKPAGQATNASPVLQPAPPPRTAAPNIPPGGNGPAVQVFSENAAAQKALVSGQTVRIREPVELTVTGPAPGEGFVYALYRDGQEIHRSAVLEPGTRVKLRPDAPGAPGLLPGLLWFVAWGSGRDNQLGPARLVPLEVAAGTAPDRGSPS